MKLLKNYLFNTLFRFATLGKNQFLFSKIKDHFEKILKQTEPNILIFEKLISLAPSISRQSK